MVSEQMTSGQKEPLRDAPTLPSLEHPGSQGKGLKAAVGVASGIGGYLIARYVPGGVVLLVMLGLPVLLGVVAGRKWGGRERLRAVLAWSCLLAWLVPPAGAGVSGYVLAAQDRTAPSTVQRVLSGIALALSLANGVVGAFIAQHK
jgi:hypothetical protein